MNGKGQLNLASGDLYSGRFRDGLFDGHGEYFDANGEIYTGSFSAGERHGYGEVQKPDGNLIKGTWTRGEMLQDTVEIRYKDGRRYVGSVDSVQRPNG
jgi:hypothetical protein